LTKVRVSHSLQRTLRRLPARRQQRLLAGDVGRFAALEFGGHGISGGFAVFATLALLGTVLNYWLGRWFDGPPPLGLDGILGSAFTGAGLWIAAGAVVSHRRALAGREVPRRAIASALRRELHVADRSRAELEALAFTAARAWVFGGDRVERLLLECVDGEFVGLCGPGVGDRFAPAEPVGRRFTIERLRWTGTVLSLATGGAALPLTAARWPDAEDGGTAPKDDGTALVAHDGITICEVWQAHELPPMLAVAIGRAPAPFR
jgi:hypothetical protein